MGVICIFTGIEGGNKDTTKNYQKTFTHFLNVPVAAEGEKGGTPKVIFI